MKLWSGVLSPFSAKVRIVLAEKQLDYEIGEIPWSRRTLWGPKPPEFLAVSPHGKVPALVDGDVTIHDSTVIVEYLEDRSPDPPLYPRDPAGRARCRQLEDEADQTMAGPVTALVQEMFTKTDDRARDTTRVADAMRTLGTCWTRLERTLGDREHLCGAFTVADVATFLVVGFANTFGAGPGDAHPRLRGWFDRVLARPTVGREFQAMMAAAATV